MSEDLLQKPEKVLAISRFIKGAEMQIPGMHEDKMTVLRNRYEYLLGEILDSNDLVFSDDIKPEIATLATALRSELERQLLFLVPPEQRAFGREPLGPLSNEALEQTISSVRNRLCEELSRLPPSCEIVQSTMDAFLKIAAISPVHADLMRFMCFMNTEYLFEVLMNSGDMVTGLDECLQKTNDPLQGILEILESLQTNGLIKINLEKQTVTVDPYIQEIIKAHDDT